MSQNETKGQFKIPNGAGLKAKISLTENSEPGAFFLCVFRLKSFFPTLAISVKRDAEFRETADDSR
jgi:hypothetical protein